MSQKKNRKQLKITISEDLYQQLLRAAESRNQSVADIIQDAVASYVENRNLTSTRTWDLCGAFAVAETETNYVIGERDSGEPITNYAEHVDDIVYPES